jgi:hypothetical protein
MVFCGVEPKAGRHLTKTTPTCSSPEFAVFMLEIAEHYPAAEAIHLVVDNLSTQTAERWSIDSAKPRVDGMGAFHGSLHAQTWRLAESGRHRNQSLHPPMPGEHAELGTSLHSAARPKHGTTTPIATKSKSSGSSPENKLVARFIALSRGQALESQCLVPGGFQSGALRAGEGFSAPTNEERDEGKHKAGDSGGILPRG